jgi:hypothetical protein
MVDYTNQIRLNFIQKTKDIMDLAELGILE